MKCDAYCHVIALHGWLCFLYSCRELEKQNKETECERLSLQQDLQNEKMTKIRAESRISELEKNMRDVRVEMEQKIETGTQMALKCTKVFAHLFTYKQEHI